MNDQNTTSEKHPEEVEFDATFKLVVTEIEGEAYTAWVFKCPGCGEEAMLTRSVEWIDFPNKAVPLCHKKCKGKYLVVEAADHEEAELLAAKKRAARLAYQAGHRHNGKTSRVKGTKGSCAMRRAALANQADTPVAA